MCTLCMTQRRAVWLNPPTSARRWHSAWRPWRRGLRVLESELGISAEPSSPEGVGDPE